MNDTAAIVGQWCIDQTLPEQDQLFEALCEEASSLFTPLEGPFWDFKDSWPFSYSDEYFGGLARLVCAFANTAGGIVIFGVHDKKRTGGHNKVVVNIDRFQQAFQQLTSVKIDFSFSHYESEKYGAVDILLVPRRAEGTPPIRFSKAVGRYSAGILWVRSGHEVQQATPAHFPVLFCRSPPSSSSMPAALDGSLPPSPATVKRFVGRIEVLDQLFAWLQNSDEPRTYLCGKGGSGKTTIAYELSRLVKDYGANLRLVGGDPIDLVLFLSAKERTLVTPDLRIGDIADPDFVDESTLWRQVLIFGGWTNDAEALSRLEISELRKEVTEFFGITSCLLVLDDIDTLTTKGVDPGSDFLFRALSRSKRNSKVLYTLRNVPSQSILNSIEVPGLGEVEYCSFVAECAGQFGVPQPTEEFRDRKLTALSERRPLVIESIIALRRTAGSYEQSARLFEQQGGDDVREYVFKREWDALPPNGIARLLLAALSDFNEPTNFTDLQAVLQVDPSVVRDAVGAVREMFFNIDDTGQEALYTLAPLTRSFVDSRKSTISSYAVLRERIRAFKRKLSISNPRVANLSLQVERIVPCRYDEHSPERVAEAWRIVSDKTLPPAVTEDPLFKSFYGYVAVCAAPFRLVEAREAFSYSWTMGAEVDFRYLRHWMEAEKRSGVDDGWMEKIADHVIDGKSYAERDKIEMIGRKGSNLYARAKNRIFTDPTDALKDFELSVIMHLRAYRLNLNKNTYHSENSKLLARNTARELCYIVQHSDSPLETVDCFRRILAAREIFADPIADPFLRGIELIASSSARAEQAHQLRNRLRGLIEELMVRDRWSDEQSYVNAVDSAKLIEKNLLVRTRSR